MLASKVLFTVVLLITCLLLIVDDEDAVSRRLGPSVLSSTILRSPVAGCALDLDKFPLRDEEDGGAGLGRVVETSDGSREGSSEAAFYPPAYPIALIEEREHVQKQISRTNQ